MNAKFSLETILNIFIDYISGEDHAVLIEKYNLSEEEYIHILHIFERMF